MATAGFAEADTAPLRPLAVSPQPGAGAAPTPPPAPAAVGVADRPTDAPGPACPSPAPAVAVRLLGPGDAAAAREVLGRSGAASALAVGARYRADEALAALLAGEGTIWLGAELDGRLVGLARLVPGADPATRHTARLDPLAVDCEALGRGVGSALLAEALRWADGHLGLARLATQVYADGERAARFYTDRGFVAEGVARRALFADGRHRDVLLLARTRE